MLGLNSAMESPPSGGKRFSSKIGSSELPRVDSIIPFPWAAFFPCGAAFNDESPVSPCDECRVSSKSCSKGVL